MDGKLGRTMAGATAVAALLLAAAGAALGPHEDPAGGGPMRFRAHVVEPALSLGADLYEPALTVSPTGTLYVAGHAPATYTTRAPVFVSRDDGRTWTPLPGAWGQADRVPGDGRLNGGEGIVAADAGGRAWLFDNGAANVALTTWCDEGRRECRHDPLAWDRPSALHPCGADRGDDLTVPDRPWIAHGAGKLLLVVSAAKTQIGLHDPATGVTRFNLCAADGATPGPGALRDADGLFAVPQAATPRGPLRVLLGTDVADVRETTVFPALGPLACESVNWGVATFSAAGTLYVAAALDEGALGVATSRDGGATFTTTRLPMPPGLTHPWIAGNPRGEGALLTYALASHARCEKGTDFHAAHLRLQPDGTVLREDDTLVAPDVPRPAGHYVKGDVGPDGRAYLVTFGAGQATPVLVMPHTTGERPLRVHVQTDGPVL